MTDVDCRDYGPDGAVCAKTRLHRGDHGGISVYGDWTTWGRH